LLHHRLAGGVDRNRGREIADHVFERRQAFVRDQQRSCAEPRAFAQQHAQHHFAFGHEKAVAAGQVALAHPPIGGDALVVRIIDGDEVCQIS
jgi:hypothetical protein